MYKLKAISIGGIILIVLVFAIQAYHYCGNDDSLARNLQTLDFNQDGKVSRLELKHYLNLLTIDKNKEIADWNAIKKQILGGIFRGFLIGIVLNDMEGGIALGLVLGAINPVLYTAEKTIYN